MLDAGTSGEVLTSFKSLHSAVAEMESCQPAPGDVLDWIASSSLDFTFAPSDFRRLLPRDRVNLVGAVSTGASPSGAGEGGVEAAGNLLSAAAWEELREKLQRVEKDKLELEWKIATESDQLKRKLAESDRRNHELNRQLKRVVPNSSMYLRTTVVSQGIRKRPAGNRGNAIPIVRMFRNAWRMVLLRHKESLLSVITSASESDYVFKIFQRLYARLPPPFHYSVGLALKCTR